MISWKKAKDQPIDVGDDEACLDLLKLAMKGELQDAAIAEVVTQFPLSSGVRFTVAGLELRRGNREKALEHLAIGLAMNPDDPMLLRRLAQVIGEGESDGARAALLEKGWKAMDLNAKTYEGDLAFMKERWFSSGEIARPS